VPASYRLAQHKWRGTKQTGRAELRARSLTMQAGVV
jgi:hypothetical protein